MSFLVWGFQCIYFSDDDNGTGGSVKDTVDLKVGRSAVQNPRATQQNELLSVIPAPANCMQMQGDKQIPFYWQGNALATGFCDRPNRIPQCRIQTWIG